MERWQHRWQRAARVGLIPAAAAALIGVVAWRAVLQPRAAGALEGLRDLLAPAPAVQEVRLGFPWWEPGAPREIRLDDRPTLRRISAALDDEEAVWRRRGQPPPRFAVRYVARLLPRGGAAARVGQTLWVGPGFRLFDGSSGAELGLPLLQARLAEAARWLDRRTFGELLSWERANPLFPVDAEEPVEDLRTGRTFLVHRYGGHRHADIEPASARDTGILEAILGGRWTWARRPVVVTLAGRRIAASINGMPHGYGVVEDNRFPGHFCLHFWGSRVHTSGRVDPAHQLMVLQAAGLMAATFEAESPDGLARWVLAAVGEQDTAPLQYALDRWQPEELVPRLARVRHLTVLGIDAPRAAPPGAPPGVEAAVTVEAVVYFTAPEPDAGYRRRWDLWFVRRPVQWAWGAGGWLVRADSLNPLLAAPAPPSGGGPREVPTLQGGGEDWGC